MIKDFVRAVIAVIMLGVSVVAYDEYSFFAAERNIVKVTNIAGSRGGTGFLIKTKKGLRVMTNEHVCSGAATPSGLVFLEKNNELASGRIVAKSEKADLCLIEPSDTLGGTGLSFARNIQRNERIWVMGHPYLAPLTEAKGRAVGLAQATVLISIREKPTDPCRKYETPSTEMIFGFIPAPVCLRTYTVVQISALAYPGNSGSPVFNKWGNVVGVIFLSDERMHTGSMVPLNEVKTFISEFEAGL